MKKYFLIILLIILLAATVIFLVPKIRNSNHTNFSVKSADIISEVKKPDDDDCCRVIKASTSGYSDMSVYLSKGKWTDQNGNKTTLSKFKNKKIVLAMFFASCVSACPVIVNDMKRIEANISPSQIDDYRFVLVSIDPERDTPSVLHKYAEERNLDLKRWKLLTGSRGDIMELGMMLGFKYSKNESGGFTHTNLISFLNRKGEIIYQNDGLELDMNSVTKAIASLE